MLQNGATDRVVGEVKVKDFTTKDTKSHEG
jgi:hypothetical protein